MLLFVPEYIILWITLYFCKMYKISQKCYRFYYLYNVKDGCVSMQSACVVYYYNLLLSTFYYVLHFLFCKMYERSLMYYRFCYV